MHAPVFAPLSEQSLVHVRRAVRKAVPTASSSHVAEALARALGFRTHAALLAAVDAGTPRWRQLDEDAFHERLNELGGVPSCARPGTSLFPKIEWPAPAGVIKTDSPGFRTAKYASKRALAWRNMMVLAVNEGLHAGLFTMRPDGNHWSPTAAEDAREHRPQERCVHDFVVDGEIPAMAVYGDGGFGELRVYVALWPSDSARRVLGAMGAGFRAGEAVADGWVERRDGAHLQTASRPTLFCRRELLDRVAALRVEPLCFADRGSFRI